MTRLVGVRALCDGCCAAAAAVFCVSHRHVLCRPCDLAQHGTPAAKSHQRTDLSSAVTALPFCEHCDDAPATIYCENEGSTLCDKCDTIVHESVEVQHWRTPIEKTLQIRAVEFRVSSRPRQTGRPRPSQAPDADASRHQTRSPEKRQNGKDCPKPEPQVYSNPGPLHSTSSLTRQCRMPTMASRSCSASVSSAAMNQKNDSRVQQSLKQAQQRQAVTPAASTAPPSALRHSTTQQRRRPRPLIKRKRDIQRSAEQVHNRPLDIPFSRTQLSAPDEFFAYTPVIRTSQPIPYTLPVDASSQQQSQPQPFQEPLLIESDSRYLDFDMLSYENLDISGEATAIEGINGSGKSVSLSGSAAESGASSRRKTPDTDMPPYDARLSRNAPTQAALREVMASAVAVAGEQYLLKNASSGSGSSGDRESPPVDILCPPDPAGLVAAVTAAAASVVAQANAGVDLSSQELKASPAPLTSDVMAEALTGRMRQPRNVRRMSDPGMPSARDLAKVEAAREAISDEAIRRLEIETRRSKQGDLMIIDSGEGERVDGNGDQLVAQMSDGEDVLRRGEEMVYLDMSRDDFGAVFDPIDLSQFEQSGSGGLGFGTGEFRPTLDSDEG